MKSDIWYPHYIGDYQRDTQHLTTLEHGAYRLLLDTCYASGGCLPNDDGDLARITKLSLSDWLAIRSRIAAFFQIDQGPPSVWRHKRVSIELEKARKQYERKSLGARKTNEKRWPKPSHSESLSDTLPVSPSQPQPQPVQTPPLPPVGGNGNGQSELPVGPVDPSPTIKRLNRLFRRRDGTRWSPKEEKALKTAGEIAEEDFQILERYYRASIPKEKDYRRKDMLTLLNNLPGEIDRARNFKMPTCF